MTTPDHTLAARLADPNAIHINMLNGRIAKPSVTQIVHIYAGQLITTAEADARVEAAVEACAVFLETHEVGLNFSKGYVGLNFSKGYVVSPRNELSGGTHPGEAYAAAIRARGVTG